MLLAQVRVTHVEAQIWVTHVELVVRRPRSVTPYTPSPERSGRCSMLLAQVRVTHVEAQIWVTHEKVVHQTWATA